LNVFYKDVSTATMRTRVNYWFTQD